MAFTAMFFILGEVAGFSLEERMMEADRKQRTSQLMAQKADLERLHYQRMEEMTREYGTYVHELENSLRTIRQLWESGNEEAKKERAAERKTAAILLQSRTRKATAMIR